MTDQEDAELKRIRMEKLKELMERQQASSPQHEEKKWPEAPILTTDKTLSGIINNYPLVVIDCWAEWCSPCHMVAPVIEELARDYAGKIVFGKLNTDENRMSANNYNIMSIPTLLIFKNGKLIDQVIGAMPRQMLEPMITKYL